MDPDVGSFMFNKMGEIIGVQTATMGNQDVFMPFEKIRDTMALEWIGDLMTQETYNYLHSFGFTKIRCKTCKSVIATDQRVCTFCNAEQ